jgi:hypothetical protein
LTRFTLLMWHVAKCINLILEGIDKIYFIGDVIKLVKNIDKFIYNHASMLSINEEIPNNKELACSSTMFCY